MFYTQHLLLNCFRCFSLSDIINIMQLTSNIIVSMLISICFTNVFSYSWVRMILQSFLGCILLAHDYVITFISANITVTISAMPIVLLYSRHEKALNTFSMRAVVGVLYILNSLLKL